MKFKAASFNVGKAFNEGHIELLTNYSPDLICIQEFPLRDYPLLLDSGLFDFSFFSLSYMHPKLGGQKRKYGVIIAGRQPFKPLRAAIFSELSLPERGMVCLVDSPVGSIGLASFFIQPQNNWDINKPGDIKKIASWMKGQNNRTLIGIDAHTPIKDHPNLDESEWWWQDEASMFSSNSKHSFTDSFRTYLKQNPEKLYSIRDEKPEGPLAVSFNRGSKADPLYCRYDYLLATPDLKVIDSQYLYDASLKAGSEHALHITNYKIDA